MIEVMNPKRMLFDLKAMNIELEHFRNVELSQLRCRADDFVNKAELSGGTNNNHISFINKYYKRFLKELDSAARQLYNANEEQIKLIGSTVGNYESLDMEAIDSEIAELERLIREQHSMDTENLKASYDRILKTRNSHQESGDSSRYTKTSNTLYKSIRDQFAQAELMMVDLEGFTFDGDHS